MYYGTPPIVTSGLVVYVDAANGQSYVSGSGTTVRDISGNAKNGTLTNGTFYSSDFGGVFNFDGVNDTINFGTGNTFFPLSSFTIDLWFQSKGTVPTTGTQPGLFGFTFGIWTNFTSANNIRFGASSGSTVATQVLNYTHTSNFRDDGQWYNINFQVTPTSSSIYLNGEPKASRSVTWLGDTAYPTNGWNLGRDNNNVNQLFTGSIASYKMYNRALSQQEITQNYNALKSRFGLQ
jgi:hypothetical protein